MKAFKLSNIWTWMKIIDILIYQASVTSIEFSKKKSKLK